MTTKYSQAKQLSAATLNRIQDQSTIGSMSLVDLARMHGVSRSSLSHQMKVARDKGLLPKLKVGRPKTLRGHLDKHMQDVPRDNTFNPSDIGVDYDRG